EDPRVSEGLTHQLADRRAALDAGARSLGWKVGFGAPAGLDLMQISAPLMGYLTDATVIQSGAAVDSAGWERGIVEFELAVYLGRDLEGGASEDDARAAVSAVGPAIELANINLDLGPAQVSDIVAGDIFHKYVMFGPPDKSRAGLDITGLLARILVDGKEHSRTADLEAITGPYPWIVATVANTLAAHGEILAGGDVIITGSVIPPIPVTDGTEFSFHLDPFAPLSVVVS
ncbi:MAG: fumarylacetoacetate hydrolase family protein, partial [Acidimicrobiia bacterium]